jgi:hypothetical protein
MEAEMSGLALLVVPEWVVIGGFAVVLLAVWLGISSMMARRRSRAVAAVAAEMGFSFEEKSKGPERGEDLKTWLFQRGTGKTFRNVMAGSTGGLKAGLFDYSYVVSDGNNAKTVAQTVAAFARPGLAMAEFEIEPMGIVQKIGEALTHKNIRFDTHPDLAHEYQIRSPEVEQTRELFTGDLLTYLEGLDTQKKWRLEGLGETLILYRSGKRVRPEELKGFLEEASVVAGSFFGLGSFRLRE